MDVHATDSADGVRLSWNVWPCNKLDATRIVVPLGCLYTPMAETTNLQLVEYDPVVCRSRSCGVILNPFCTVDFHAKTWTCPCCLQRNAFPSHYAEHITESNLPTELHPMCTTMEYIIPQSLCSPPVFLIVLDISLIEDELEQVKDSLQQCLATMPHAAIVGFITFGAMCYVHELGSTALPRAYAFRGNKDTVYSKQQVAYQLGFSTQNSRQFLMPVSECEFTLNSILDDLTGDAWPVGTAQRSARCTGVALSVAVGLLEVTYPQSSARIMLMAGGPCTIGMGAVVAEDLSEPIRSHLDLQRDNKNARFTKNALTFYTGLASRAAQSGFAVDIFVGSLDQVGLHEMKVLCEKSGGYMVMADSFSTNVFKDSFKKMFQCDDNGYLQLGFNAKIELITSTPVKLNGAVGSLTSLRRKGSAVSETEIGEGGTCQWQIGSLDKNTTIGFFFDIDMPSGVTLQGKRAHVQFQTAYLHPSGRKRLRVTTISQQIGDSSNMTDIKAGFDQEAAAILIARRAVARTETEDSLDVYRWVDRCLIRVVSKFANYRRDNPSSFSLSREFSLFPQIIYHLRRSNLLQTFNASPDETAYYRTQLLRENTINSIVMIQPALLTYSMNEEGPPKPVLLDSVNLKPNVILLLDTFFHIVIWRGDTIQHWYEQKFQDNPDYAGFKSLLAAPEEDAKQILNSRFPAPKLVQTNAGGSQARFLTSKVNPSNTHNSGAAQTSGTPMVFTDDVPLKVFMEHLIRVAVQS